MLNQLLFCLILLSHENEINFRGFIYFYLLFLIQLLGTACFLSYYHHDYHLLKMKKFLFRFSIHFTLSHCTSSANVFNFLPHILQKHRCQLPKIKDNTNKIISHSSFLFIIHNQIIFIFSSLFYYYYYFSFILVILLFLLLLFCFFINVSFTIVIFTSQHLISFQILIQQIATFKSCFKTESNKLRKKANKINGIRPKYQ